MSKILFWLRNARIVALPQSLLPAITALCLAIGTEKFSIALGLLAIFGVIFAHLSANLLDDYFDYVNDKNIQREKLAESKSFVRTEKSPYLYSGEVSPKKLFAVATFFAFIALLFGTVIFATRGFSPLIIALIAGFLGFFYSAEPIKFCYRGLGELITGVIFGPLLMSGVYYAAAGNFSPIIWPISIIVGILVTNILFTHSIMDYNPDVEVGKKTLAGILKSPKLNLSASAIFNFLPYIIIVIAVILNILPIFYLFTFIVLPRSIYLFYLLYEFYYNPTKKFEKKRWLGPMENWDKIEEHNLQWFAIRWYLSRNITQLFCLIVIICNFL